MIHKCFFVYKKPNSREFGIHRNVTCGVLSCSFCSLISELRLLLLWRAGKFTASWSPGKHFLQTQKTWQSSTTAPKLHTQLAKHTVNTAYLGTPTLLKALLQISVQGIGGQGMGYVHHLSVCTTRSAVQWEISSTDSVLVLKHFRGQHFSRRGNN